MNEQQRNGQIMAVRCRQCAHQAPGYDEWGVRCLRPDPDMTGDITRGWFLYPSYFNPMACNQVCTTFAPRQVDLFEPC